MREVVTSQVLDQLRYDVVVDHPLERGVFLHGEKSSYAARANKLKDIVIRIQKFLKPHKVRQLKTRQNLIFAYLKPHFLHLAHELVIVDLADVR